jgi:uncharacterized membrane protein
METRVRSWVKSLVWRVAGVILMPIIILCVYSTVGPAAGKVALWSTVIFHGLHVILYYVHERLWLRTKWGTYHRRYSGSQPRVYGSAHGESTSPPHLEQD